MKNLMSKSVLIAALLGGAFVAQASAQSMQKAHPYAGMPQTKSNIGVVAPSSIYGARNGSQTMMDMEEEELQMFVPSSPSLTWQNRFNSGAFPSAPGGQTPPDTAARNGISALVAVTQLKSQFANEEALAGADEKRKPKPKPKPKK